MDIVYCIEHEHMVSRQNSQVGYFHDYPVYVDGMLEYDWCDFPKGYAYSEPPEDLPEGWQDELIEPSEEELDSMCAEADYG